MHLNYGTGIMIQCFQAGSKNGIYLSLTAGPEQGLIDQLIKQIAN